MNDFVQGIYAVPLCKIEESTTMKQKSNQLSIAMKLLLILLAINIQVVASGYSQMITLSVKKAPLRDVMNIICKQSGYSFRFESSNLDKAKLVTTTISSMDIVESLKLIFTNQPFDYKVENKLIYIQPKRVDNITNRENFVTENYSIGDSTREITIKGLVTDSKQKPIIGVSIRVKGTSSGTTTDNNGRYMLTVKQSATVFFSFIGYKTIEKIINNSNQLNITLLDVSSQLDQVQIIAYGTTTRRMSTSNISTIKGDEVARQPISNLLLGIQGRAPGITITQTSGVPGSDVKVRVQGENSLRNGNEAFYVIDGIPYTPQNLYSGINGGIMPGSGSALSFLNPADVESIEVLKDADATAIYGSRAANGAILITTRKGKAGRTKVDLSIQNGWSEVDNKVKLLNTQQYLEIRKEAVKNGGGAPSPTDYDINGTWDTTRNTDWQKELLGRTSRYTNIQASVSGGTSETQFLAGGGYIKETTVFLGDFSDAKENFHLSINHLSPNKKFQFGVSSNYLQDVNKLPSLDLTAVAIKLSPDAPNLYNSDGSINWQPRKDNPNSVTFGRNPAGALLRKYRANTNNLLMNAQIGYRILPELNLKSTFGYNRLQTYEISTVPQASLSPLITANSRAATYGTKIGTTWIIEPQLTYNKSWPSAKIDGLVACSFQSASNSVVAYNGSQYPNDDQLENSLAAGKITPNYNTTSSEYRYNAIFGRINYQLKEKYIINVSTRRDGSSRFGSENLFHSFYSMGGAWIFSDESWFKDNISIISFGKLRASYGTSGNDQINDYQFLNLYQAYNYIAIPYQQTVGLLPSGHSNPYLQWEETRKLNFGLDLGVYNDRIIANINYYMNRSSNQLLDYNLPGMTGFLSVLRNIPALVQNSGWEISFEANAFDKKNFKWQITGNVTIPRSKLVDYPGLAESSSKDTYVIGKSPNIAKVFEFAGVDPETGYYQFKTHDGKLTSDPDYQTDKTKVVTLGQTLYGGLINNFRYKNFELSFLFQFVKQMGMNYKFGTNYPGLANSNQPISIMNRWQKVGDHKKEIQQVTTSADAFNPFYAASIFSDASYSDASFIRLKTLSLRYSVPSNLLDKIHISGAQIYVQGINLLTFTKFKWADPESMLPGILPPLRSISTGIQLTF